MSEVASEQYKIVPNRGVEPFIFDQNLTTKAVPESTRETVLMDGFHTHFADYDDPPVRVYFRGLEVLLIQIEREHLHLFMLDGAPIDPLDPSNHPVFSEAPQISWPLDRKIEFFSIIKY